MENVSKFLILLPKRKRWWWGQKTRKYFPYGANVRTWHSNISHYYRNTSAVYHQRCQSDFFFFCFDRYLNQWHFNIFWELLGLLGALKLAAMLYFLVLKNLMMNERIGLDFFSLSFIQIQSIPKQVILEQYWIAKSSAFAYFTIILK